MIYIDDLYTFECYKDIQFLTKDLIKTLEFSSKLKSDFSKLPDEKKTKIYR